MSLEVEVLGKAMQGRLEDVDRKLLRDREVRSALTSYFSEREVRPEVVAAIRAPSLMIEYFRLSLEERVELDKFRVRFPNYFSGEGNSKVGRELNNLNQGQICRKVRFTNELLELFDFYLKNRSYYDVFTLIGKAFNKKFKQKAANLHRNIKKNFNRDCDVEEFFKYAAELRPEITDFTSFDKVFMIDAPKQLVGFFDFYLRNREEGQTFGSGYFIQNKTFKERFGNAGSNLYDHAKKRGRDVFKRLLELASKERPEITDHRSRKGVLKIDAPRQLIRIFDFYLQNREYCQPFTIGYLKENMVLKKEFGGLGASMLKNIRFHFGSDGLSEVIEIACRERPQIKEYLTRESVFEKDAPLKLIEMFDFYLQNRKAGQKFNVKYLILDSQLGEHFGTLGQNMYDNCRAYYGTNGEINFLIELASKKRPEILEYWQMRKSPRRKIRQ